MGNPFTTEGDEVFERERRRHDGLKQIAAGFAALVEHPLPASSHSWPCDDDAALPA